MVKIQYSCYPNEVNGQWHRILHQSIPFAHLTNTLLCFRALRIGLHSNGQSTRFSFSSLSDLFPNRQLSSSFRFDPPTTTKPMGLVAFQQNGAGDLAFSGVPLGPNKYRRMDSELDEDHHHPHQRSPSSSTTKYVLACAVFASLNSVLLGYGMSI